MRGGGGIPDGIPLRHVAECEWQRGIIMGRGGTSVLRGVARQAREQGPLALIYSIDEERIGWSRVYQW